SSILKDEPPAIGSVQPLAPSTLDRIVRKCLTKDPDYRWQTARDLVDELKWVAEIASQSGLASGVVQSGAFSDVEPQVLTPRKPPYARIGAAALFVTTLGLAAMMYLRRPPGDTRVYRSSFVPPANLTSPAVGRLALSPDGRRLAFIAPDSSSRSVLWVRALDSLIAQPLPATAKALSPFWSLDSRFIAFVADGKLKKIDVSAGPPVTLCEANVTGTGSRRRGITACGWLPGMARELVSRWHITSVLHVGRSVLGKFQWHRGSPPFGGQETVFIYPIVHQYRLPQPVLSRWPLGRIRI